MNPRNGFSVTHPRNKAELEHAIHLCSFFTEQWYLCLQLFISFILAFHHLEATDGCSRGDSKELDGCLHVQLQQLSQTVRQIQRTTAFTTQGQYLFSAHYIVCLPFIAQLWHDMSSVELLYSCDFNHTIAITIEEYFTLKIIDFIVALNWHILLPDWSLAGRLLLNMLTKPRVLLSWIWI